MKREKGFSHLAMWSFENNLVRLKSLHIDLGIVNPDSNSLKMTGSKDRKGVTHSDIAPIASAMAPGAR